MEKILEIISKSPLFHNLGEEDLKKIRGIAQDKLYDKGRTVFLEGGDARGFYLVVDGKVKIFKGMTTPEEVARISQTEGVVLD